MSTLKNARHSDRRLHYYNNLSAWSCLPNKYDNGITVIIDWRLPEEKVIQHLQALVMQLSQGAEIAGEAEAIERQDAAEQAWLERKLYDSGVFDEPETDDADERKDTVNPCF